MPPPAAFIDITSIPFSRTVTQAEFNAGTFGNVANEVWLRKIATVAEVLGMRTDSGGTFVPRTRVFEADGSTAVDPLRTGTFGQWSALTTPATYYIQIVRNGGGASDFDFTSEFDTVGLDNVVIEPGDLIINDDLDRPGTVVAADGTLKGFVTNLPGGEMGAILQSGVSIWHDRYGHFGANKLAILDANLQYIGGADAGLTGVNFPKFAADATQFYVMNQFGDLWTVSAAAVEANTGYSFPLAHDLPQAFGVNAAGTILYWATEDEDGVIRTVDLGTLLDAADFYTIPGFVSSSDKIARTANAHPGELFVLDDGSVVTYWFEDAELTFHLIRISAAGSLLQDIEYADPIQLDHIAQVYGQSAYVVIWLYTSGFFNEGQFGRLTFSTGLITEDFTRPLFEDGVNMLDGVKFGISTSCSMVVMQGLVVESPGEGPGSPGVLPDGEIGPIAWVEEWEDAA